MMMQSMMKPLVCRWMSMHNGSRRLQGRWALTEDPPALGPTPWMASHQPRQPRVLGILLKLPSSHTLRALRCEQNPSSPCLSDSERFHQGGEGNMTRLPTRL